MIKEAIGVGLGIVLGAAVLAACLLVISVVEYGVWHKRSYGYWKWGGW